MSISFRVASSAAGADTTVVTVPPAVEPGDALLLFAAVNSGATITAPAGWSSIDSRSITTNVAAKVYVRVAQAGDAGTTVTLTNTGTASGKSVALIAAYAGVDPVNPVHLSAGATETVSGAAHAVPSVTTTIGNAWAVHAAVAKDTGTAWTPPAGSTTRSQVFAGGAGQVSAALSDRSVPLHPGATGAVTYTSNAATAHAFTWTIALRPAIEIDPLFPDTEGILVSYLAGRPELAGTPVGLTLPSTNDGTSPYVVVSRIGGGYQVDAALEYAWLRFDTYAASASASHDLMRRVRAVLRGITSTYVEGSVFSDITEELGGRGLRRMSDTARPTANRYALNIWAMVRLS